MYRVEVCGKCLRVHHPFNGNGKKWMPVAKGDLKNIGKHDVKFGECPECVKKK